MRRSSIVALVVVGLTALCVGSVCAGAAVIGPGSILGCDTDPTPAVPTVQDDPHRVAELFPRLGFAPPAAAGPESRARQRPSGGPATGRI